MRAVNRSNFTSGAIRVLLAGGNSRSGRAFRARMAGADFVKLTTLVRNPAVRTGSETLIPVGDHFAPPQEILRTADTVINFAGLPAGRNESMLQTINVDGPLLLARAAKAAGVRHFIQLSSTHVYGYAENVGKDTAPNPMTAYARSKLRADTLLLNVASEDFTVSLLRTPMHYGGDSGENLKTLIAILAKLRFFPVASQPCKRSVLHCDNLAAALEELVRNPAPGISLAADDEPLTIELLAQIISETTDRKPRLVSLPKAALLPLGLFMPGVYAKLFRQNLLRHADCVAPVQGLPVTLRRGLMQLVSEMNEGHGRT